MTRASKAKKTKRKQYPYQAPDGRRYGSKGDYKKAKKGDKSVKGIGGNLNEKTS